MAAFILNLIWENLHSLLYSGYQGEEITESILITASLLDALMITIISLPFLYFIVLRNKYWLVFIIGIIVAIPSEWYFLNTGRWAYNELMPIIPIIKTGLTPTIQLGLLGYITIKIQKYFIPDFS